MNAPRPGPNPMNMPQRRQGGAAPVPAQPPANGGNPPPGRRLAAQTAPPQGEPGANPALDFFALAPYGTIPLPETPMPAERLQDSALALGVPPERLLSGHDARVPGTLTGWIDLDIHALTPLFVGTTQEEGEAARSAHLDGRPAIPGSSLRGLLRNHLRLLTGGETGPVNTPQLFFRAPAAPSLKTEPGDSPQERKSKERASTVLRTLNGRYRARGGMPPSPPGQPVNAGFLKRKDGRWWVRPLATDRPLQIRLPYLKEDLEETFGEDFALPRHKPENEGAKLDTYVPAVTHRTFQYRQMVAVCPKVSGKYLGQYRFHALTVLPMGEKVEPDDKEMACFRIEEIWGERRDRANEDWQEADKKVTDAIQRGTHDRVAEEKRAAANQRRTAFIDAIAQISRLKFTTHDCVLVLTGVAGERKNAYLFPTWPGHKEPLPVPDELVRMVESADQITRYQRDNFPDDLAMNGVASVDRPRVGNDDGGGLARTAPEPVWFQASGGEVVSFGRSGGYRVAVGDFDPITKAVPPAVLSPQHRDPDRNRDRVPDVPRAVFGDIDLFPGDEGRVTAARGRVSVGTALSDTTGAEFTNPLRVELLSPQRGCFANYLLQPVAGAPWSSTPDLVTWAHEGDVRLGGYKVYLHRHDANPNGARAADRYQRLRPRPGTTPQPTERDVRPVREGTVFHGRVTFTNLTHAEVGALMRALLLDNPVSGANTADPEYAHKIGLGKPLGLGSVHITPRLHLVSPRERALSLNPLAGVRAADDAKVQALLSAFDDALLEWEREQPRAPRAAAVPGRWREIDRVRELLCAARWRERLPESWTRTMTLEEFARFPVLAPISQRFARYADMNPR